MNLDIFVLCLCGILAMEPHNRDFQIEALLMNDVANHVMKALTTVEKRISIQKPPTFSCDSEDVWEHGGLMQQEILKVNLFTN